MKLHVRLSGTSRTYPAEEFGIERESSNDAVKEILSGFLKIPYGDLRNVVIDRNPDGIVVRPPAVFG